MTRVSLKEAYDNKDVVAQIYAIRDIAEGAEDTADSAVTTANTASDHVDALVPQVEGAVQNANNASASAQASAQTVAGYETRLSAVEGETAGLDSDLNAVTLRVTTAEGQIVTIQGRVTALETADGQNVKLTGTQTIGGVKHFADSPTAPTTETGLWDVQVANGLKIKNELDNYAPMVRTANAQVVGGEKRFTSPVIGQTKPYKIFGSNSNAGWYAICKFSKTNARQAKITVQSPGTYNVVLTDTGSSTHNLNALKVVGSYAPNRNAFLLAETADGYIFYVWSATYRTNILTIDYLGAYGTPIDYITSLDDSVFTGQPETTKPSVGGDIVAIYDETLLGVVTQ